jgi:putative hydrolase
MSERGFGFRPEDPDDGDSSSDSPQNPAQGSGAGGGAGDVPGGGSGGFPGIPGMPGMPGMPEGFPFNLTGPGGQPMDIGAALQQLGQLLSWQGGPVNWDLARQAARQLVAAQGDDPSVGPSGSDAVREAIRLADLWLDGATGFPAATTSVQAWSRAEWVEGTLDGWKRLVEPVAEQVVASMGNALPAEAAAMAGPLVGVMRQLGMSLWGAQVGQGLGHLATEVIGVTDIGIPLTDAGHVAMLPRNIAAFGEGLGVDESDVRLYLALREAARHRLHAHAPWLRGHVISLVESFARGITIDTSRIESAVSELDPTRPEALQQAFESGLFEPERTPEQQATLDRLEVALATIEGWTEDVVTQAALDRLPSADALREMVRRARAAGGPAEDTFATLVGLEMRPRRARDAANLFAVLRTQQGTDARDGVWGHPDLMPDATDLDDPLGYAERRGNPLEIEDE